ncbi:Pyrroline-5-carboxylate reductase [Alphaproteobacteria bacterium]
MRLLLIGCGNLGSALLKAWVDDKSLHKIVVVEPSLSAKSMFTTVNFVSNVSSISHDFSPDIVVLAIKPQQIKTVLPEYTKYLKKAVLVSLAAGVQIENLNTYLAKNARIIRIMPNIAIQIRKSVNLAYASLESSLEDRKQVEMIFDFTGKVIWLKKEELIDALTPISGSGPAYFILLAEILTKITMNLGLEEDFARELVQETFLGSALLTSNGAKFEQMISSISSKKGVTEAALNVIRPILPNLMDHAFAAALERLKELK